MKTCTKCKIEKPLSEFHRQKNGFRPKCKTCRKEISRKYYENNSRKTIERTKKYYENNKEYYKEYKKEYRENNKERLNKYTNEYNKKRRETDALFKMKQNLRSRTYEAFKTQGYSKKTTTQEILGVDWEVAKAHIERQFTKGMSWDNYREWHIDHIIPLASAKTPERLKKLCHYSNLQPLWAEDNLEKSDKINGQQNKLRL